MTREHLTDPMHISEVLAELFTFDLDTPTNTNCGTRGCSGWTNPDTHQTAPANAGAPSPKEER